jgi:hypothetical protein
MAKAKALQAKATETVERFDPDEDFSDVDGDPRNEFELDKDSADPTRKYIWAHNSPETIGEYKGHVLKYKVEHYADGGVTPRMSAGYTEGELITRRDHVLMSCDLALWEKRERFLRKQSDQKKELLSRKRQRDSIAGRHGSEWSGLRE